MLDVTLSMNSSLNIPNECDVLCFEKFEEAKKQINIEGINSTNSNTTNINNITADIDSYNLPTYLMIDSIGDVSPGINIILSYEILDEYNNTIPLTELGINIYFTLSTTELRFSQEFEIDYTQERCIICDNGFIIPRLSIENSNGTVNMDISVDDNIVLPLFSGLSLRIDLCPPGFGIDEANEINICTECRANTVSFDYSLNECTSCSSINGVNCLGSSDILIEYNYWFNYNALNGEILSQICPPTVCCQKQDGCSYPIDNICALNRNQDSLLCSQCMDGFSELVGTNNCGECNENKLGWSLIPLFYTLLLALYFTLFSSNTVMTREQATEVMELNPRKTTIIDEVKSIKITALNVLLYYYQAMSYILLQSGLSFPSLTTFLAFFNLSFNVINVNSEVGGICFIKDLKAHSKILLDLISPSLLLIYIMIFAVINVILSKLGKDCCGKPCNIKLALWSVLLMSLGPLIQVLFSFLACLTIGDDVLHFYFAYTKCYGLEWFASLIALISIVVIGLLLLIYLVLMNPEKRQSKDNTILKLVKPYNPKQYYWEFVLLSRRIMIAGLIFLDNNRTQTTKYTLCIVLLVYLLMQIYFKPFYFGSVNIMESLCLLLLISLLILIGFFADPENNRFIEDCVIMFTILPIMIFCLYILKLFMILCNCNYKIKGIKSIQIEKRLRRVTTKAVMSDHENDLELAITPSNNTIPSPHNEGENKTKNDSNDDSYTNNTTNKSDEQTTVNITDEEIKNDDNDNASLGMVTDNEAIAGETKDDTSVKTDNASKKKNNKKTKSNKKRKKSEPAKKKNSEPKKKRTASVGNKKRKNSSKL